MPFLEFVLTSSAIASVTVAATALLSRWRRLALMTAFAGATGLIFFHGLGYLNSVPDDAYISFHYAQHLADGLGPNWNSTGRVEGYTNFLLVALLAAFGKLGFSIVVSARVLGGLSTIATLFVVYKIWTLWREDDQDSGLNHPAFLAAVFVLLGLSSGVAYYTFSGLETPLFMLLLTASAYFYFLERRGGIPWSAVTLAAAAMTRPEGLIAVAVTGLFYVIGFLGATQRPRPYGRVLAWTGVFALLYGSYFAWRFTYYDYLLPNTFYAKVEPGSAIFERGLDYLRGASSQYLLLPMFAGAAFLLARSRLRHDVAYVMAISGALLLAIIYEGGDFMPYFRFAVPVLPLLYLSGVAGFATLMNRAVAHRTQLVLIATFVLVIAGLSLLQDASRLTTDRLIERNNSPLATWFREYTPNDFKIGAVAVGVLAYYADGDIIDMAGINDTVIAHSDVPRFGAGQPGHEKYNVDYVLNEARPEIIIGLGAGPAPKRREDVDPNLVPAMSVLIADPRLWKNYRMSWLAHDRRWYSFLTRNDMASQLHGPGFVAPQNLLANSGNTSSDNWIAQGSTLVSTEDGLFVSSGEPAYGVAQFTAPLDTQLASGQHYLAVAWVRGTTRSAGGTVSISLREDDATDAETKASFRLTTDWHPVFVSRILQGGNTNRLSLHITRDESPSNGDVFVIQDAQIRLIEK